MPKAKMKSVADNQTAERAEAGLAVLAKAEADIHHGQAIIRSELSGLVAGVKEREAKLASTRTQTAKEEEAAEAAGKKEYQATISKLSEQHRRLSAALDDLNSKLARARDTLA